jgi:hypothetical protein
MAHKIFMMALTIFFLLHYNQYRYRDGILVGRPGFDSRQGQKIFFLLDSVHTYSGTHPAYYAMDARGSFPGVKCRGCEADNSPPSSAVVKNVGAIPPIAHTSS